MPWKYSHIRVFWLYIWVYIVETTWILSPLVALDEMQAEDIALYMITADGTRN